MYLHSRQGRGKWVVVWKHYINFCFVRWLPIHVRSDLMVLLVTYKILTGVALSHVSNLLKPYISSLAFCTQKVGGVVASQLVFSRAFSYWAPFTRTMSIPTFNSDSFALTYEYLYNYLFQNYLNFLCWFVFICIKYGVVNMALVKYSTVFEIGTKSSYITGISTE